MFYNYFGLKLVVFVFQGAFPLQSSISKVILIKRVLKKLARDCVDMEVILESGEKSDNLKSWISCISCCRDLLPGSTTILVPTRNSILKLKGKISDFCMGQICLIFQVSVFLSPFLTLQVLV